jgi:D-alanyl-D-alanine endopeptidase (penicillin-binding protein 7)
MSKLKFILVMLVLSIGALAQAKPKSTAIRVEPSSILYDVGAGRTLYEHNATNTISIASMTKLITVLTVFEANQNLTETIQVIGKEGSNRIRVGMTLSRADLVELAMVSSDNLAARTLMEHYPGGYARGIEAMNALANRLGATHTSVTDPTGLFAANTSTAGDIVKITQAAGQHPVFARFANQKTAEVRVERVGKTRQVFQWVTGRTTNPFVNEPVKFEMLAFKTGFTTAAGWCLTMLVSYNNRQYILVTAGNPSKQARKIQADRLIQQITNQQYRLDISEAT